MVRFEVLDRTRLFRLVLWLMLTIAAFSSFTACDSSSSNDVAESQPTATVTEAQDPATVESDSDDMSDSATDDDSMSMGMEMEIADADAEDADDSRPPFIRRAVERGAAGFTLTDQNGDLVSLNDFRGKWVVMDWIYTNCMTVCPALTGEMLRVRDSLGDRFGSEFQFVSITFDPERDDAAAMQKYAANVDADSASWSWLTGSLEETNEVAELYGVSFTPAEAMMGVAMFDHTALTVVIDPAGIERFHYYGIGWGDDLSETLDLLVPEVSVFDRPSSEPQVVVGLSERAAELLSDGTSYYWEDWELEDGLTMQSAHNFPGTIATKRYFHARMDGLEENGWTNLGKEDEDGEAFGLYYMFKNSDTDYIGVGTNENVMVEVRGEDFRDTLDALFWLGGALCCPA